MKRGYTFLLLICFAQVELFTQGWEKVYSGIPSHDNSGHGAGIQKTQITSDGGYILIGHKPDSTNTFEQVCLLKINISGDVTWSRTFPDSLTMLPESVIETNDGYLIGGSRYNPIYSFLIKVDLTGNILWSKQFNGAQSIDMIQKTTNGFILLGSNGYNASSGIYCVGINANGVIKWDKTFNTTDVYPSGIAPAENNGFIILGKKVSHIYGRGTECYILKFDSTGKMLWAKSYAYVNSFEPYCIKLTITGDYIIGGSILMKIDKNGNLLWVKQWYGTTIRDIVQTEDNGFIAAAAGNWNIDGLFLYKVSPEGTPIWEKAFGSYGDGVMNVFNTPDRGFLISGNHQSQNARGLYLIKTDSLGNSGCNNREVELLPSRVNSSLCLVNNITFLPSSNSLSSKLLFTSKPVSVNVINPCCLAKPVLTSSFYCKGDSLHFYGSGAPHLQWSTGDTTSNIVTMDTIVYLTITNTCGSFKDSLMNHSAFIPSFTCQLNKGSICVGDSVLMHITGNAPYYSFGGPNVKEIDPTTYVIKPTGTANYTVYGYTGKYGPGCGSRQTFTIYVTPDKPIISKIADTLFSSSAINNQWQLNGNNISGATSATLITNQPGTYSVRITSSGCSNVSDGFTIKQDTVSYFRNAWQNMISSPKNLFGTCLVQADDGGFIIGCNYYNSSIKDDIELLKTDRNGEFIWSKSLGGSSIDQINSLIKIKNGYVAVGNTFSFGNGNKDVFILSFDDEGQVLWMKTYGDWNDQDGHSIEQTADGGFIVTGWTTNSQSYKVNKDGWFVENNDLYLLKTDANGNLTWSVSFDASTNERGLEAHETNDGNFIVGSTSTDTLYHERVFVLKTNEKGILLWSKMIATSSFGRTGSLKITPDNAYLISTQSNKKSGLIKLDINGNVLWNKSADVGWGSATIITNDNAIILTSTLYNDRAALTKIDINGNLLWCSVYPSLGRQAIVNEIQLKDSTFLLTGVIDTARNYSTSQVNLINTDINGQTNCSQSFVPTIIDETYTYQQHTVLASEFGKGVNASPNSNSGLFQSNTICRSAQFQFQTHVEEESKNLILKVYPNPTSAIINLEISPIINNPDIYIYDLMGRCVYDQKSNSKSIYQIDMSSNAKGIYFVKIISADRAAFKKIVLN